MFFLKFSTFYLKISPVDLYLVGSHTKIFSTNIHFRDKHLPSKRLKRRRGLLRLDIIVFLLWFFAKKKRGRKGVKAVALLKLNKNPKNICPLRSTFFAASLTMRSPVYGDYDGYKSAFYLTDFVPRMRINVILYCMSKKSCTIVIEYSLFIPPVINWPNYPATG